ncbi:MAG: glycoside hydrolase family 43 protein [Clostridia bacterium]|nr:glycoside hydrolase family 43 protein [Clostridia bacterium]
MQLLKIDKNNYIGQADPFIIEHKGRYYIYTTGDDGLYGYSCDTLLGEWKFEGQIFTLEGRDHFWAPSVIELDGKFYMYFSFEYYEDVPDQGGHHQAMHVAVSDTPMGPFELAGQIAHPFSIDSHIVKTQAGLFLFYSPNTFEGERIGTHIVVQKMKDPFTLEGEPTVVLLASIDEEIFCRNRYKQGQHWHTLEGAFWFQEGEWQYLMYSGGRYEDETYFVGYAAAKTTEQDLRKVKFQKMPDENTYAPLLRSNEWEEGTGHNSVIKVDGQYYCVYHARNTEADGLNGDRRNARIAKMHVADGKITIERYPDHI